jgi:hypothetical protein
MKLFRPGLPPVFTDEDAPAQSNRAFTPAEKAAGADKPFLTPEAAMAAADARHVASGAGVQQPPSSVQVTKPAPAPTAPPAAPAVDPPQGPAPAPGASGASATTQIIPPVAPQPLIDKNAAPAPAPAATPQPEKPAPADSLALTPAEQAELDALLAKWDHSHPAQEPPKS